MRRTEIADRGDAGERLDLVLRRHLADIESATRTRVQGWIAGGLVSVNGAIVRRAASRVTAGDSVAVEFPDPPARREIRGEDIPLDVLYEDDLLLAVNKPPGLVAHPTHAHASGTLLNALFGYARPWPEGHRPSLVSRLDKLTSGVVLVAKTPGAHAVLQRALCARAAEKDYLALVYGRPPARGAIELKLQRDSVDRRRVIASPTRGASSVTRFERLALMRAPSVVLSLLRCRLITGRTHQIRAHLASSGWPIVGDPVYGQPCWQLIEDEVLREQVRTFPRQALHAWRLTFVHPVSGERVEIEAPVPGDMEALIKGLR